MKKIIAFLMILLVSISPLFRGLFFYYETTAFLAIIALLSFVYFMIKVSRRETVHYNKWLLLLGSLLVAAYGLAFINAVNPRENLSALLLVMEYLVFSIVLYDFYYEKKEYFAPSLMIPVVISGFVNAVVGIEAITGAFKFLNDTLNNRRVGGTFQYANTAAIYFAIIIIFGLTLMYTLDKPILRILLSGANSIILIAMLLTKSRGGYIVGFAAIIFLMIIQAKGYRLKTTGSFICAAIPALLLIQSISNLTGSMDALILNRLLLISCMGAIILASVYEGILFLISKAKRKITLSKPLSKAISYILVVILITSVFLLRNQIISLIPDNIIERFARISLDEVNISIRLTFDKDALKLISKNWLFGTGGGSWKILYYNVQEYYYISRAVHNHFLEIFVESGILGFFAFTSTVILSIYYMISTLAKTKEPKPRIYLAGLFAGFMVLIVHSTFDFDLSYVSLGLLFWVIVIMSSPSNKHIITFNKSCSNIILVIASSALLLMNGIYAIAAYSANIGLNLKLEGDYTPARTYYEEAIRLDPSNSTYTFELTKLYNSYADMSKTSEKKEAWRKAALLMAKRSILLNPYMPENNRILIRSYYDLGMPLEGIEYAQRLIRYQPYNNVNYELLAKGYLEAGKDYLENGNPQKAYELLENCIHIDPPEKAEGQTHLSLIKQEALSFLK